MKPSKDHNNRKWHNWIIYDNFDIFLQKYNRYYKGILVDLGCGEAPYKKYFLKFVDKYIGVDWTQSIHKSKADIVSNLNEKINLNNDFADTIISFSVMEHLCEPQQFLDESFRVLKDNGTMILQVPFQWWIHEQPHDYFRYTPYGLKYMLEKAGFSEIEIEAQTGIFTTLILKINYLTARLIKGPKLLRIVIGITLIPFWTIGQLIAPILDKLDNKWEYETQGYFVIAKKVIKKEKNECG